MPVAMNVMEITAIVCKFYEPTGCTCPARRLKWWSPRRWVLGPHPECVFDEPLWLSEPDRKLWQSKEASKETIVCPYITPPEGRK
jgi:hypothetical protein